MTSVIALIPARSGSLRIPDKNIQPLNGSPLMAYTIASAIQSGIFSSVVVSTDSAEYARIAGQYGAQIPFLRPAGMSGAESMDFEWVEFTLRELSRKGQHFDCFSLLRPTSPFRMPGTIQRAWKEFLAKQPADSLRAVEKCKQHPAKMWTLERKFMKPVLNSPDPLKAWHSTPYQALPRIYAQNASLEIAHTRVVFDQRSIAGDKILPFLTEGHEGLDINSPEDWWLAEYLIQKGTQLPALEKAAHS